MENNGEIFNRIQASGIISLNLMDYKPDVAVVEFDIVPYLYMGMVLREKEFRESMAGIDWKAYEGKVVSVFCSADAIVPQWAYILIGALLFPYAQSVAYGRAASHETRLWAERIAGEDFSLFTDKKVALKANAAIPDELLLLATQLLMGKVSALMYGEPGMPKMIYKRR
ncbi:DUF2480 family protein [Chitinophaga defluvii]|uniref:DUF2480 family protein n=1 Tax=Chitinophaga defluvii TaxID=3163343 RepID=A0ABV2T1Y1_9BACT